MGSEESTGSWTPPPQPAPAPAAFREKIGTPQNSPDRGLCFGCKQEGHWLRDCPLRAKPSPGGPAGARGYPERQCPCGRGPCIVLTSRTERNPDRDFYTCPGKSKCGFFLWCDKAIPNQQHGYNSPKKPNQQRGANSPAKPDQQHGADESSYPICSCGAGRCRVFTMTAGDNAGRQYFACRITKGQGACNHFQWVDSAAKLLEKKDYDLGETKVPNFIPVPEQPKKPEMDNGTTYNHSAKNEHPNFIPVLKGPEKPRKDDNGSDEAMNEDKAKKMLSDVSVVPESPPLTPKRPNPPNIIAEFSPIKKLNIHGDSPGASRPRKCYRCGKDGHWMSSCVGSPNSPCFKCGRFGHWKKDCTG